MTTRLLAPVERRTSSRLATAAAEGVRDITPMVVGVAPFGLAIGAAVATTSLSLGQGLFSGAGVDPPRLVNGRAARSLSPRLGSTPPGAPHTTG